MAGIAQAAVGTLVGLLQSRQGINAVVGEIQMAAGGELAPVVEEQIVSGRLVSRDGAAGYGRKDPVIEVYCARIRNLQREKFCNFSGTVGLVVEVGVSKSRPEGLEQELQQYTEAVATVLERSRGSWGQGMSFGGAYEIDYLSPKRGGKNYMQSAKVSLELNVSRPSAESD